MLSSNIYIYFFFWEKAYILMASQVALLVKNLPAGAGDVRDVGSIPGWGRCAGGGHGHPLQYSCLENPLDREAWQATVPGVAQSQTRLRGLRSSGIGVMNCVSLYGTQESQQGRPQKDQSAERSRGVE